MWRSQGSIFTENYCINLDSNEATHEFMYVSLNRTKQFSQIVIIYWKGQELGLIV